MYIITTIEQFKRKQKRYRIMGGLCLAMLCAGLCYGADNDEYDFDDGLHLPQESYPCSDHYYGFLEFGNMVFRESVHLTATPWELCYSSWRAPGNKMPYRLEIPLVGPGDAASNILTSIIHIEVADNVYDFTLYPEDVQSNEVFCFDWDGCSAAGQPLQGAWPLEATLTRTVRYEKTVKPGPTLEMSADGGSFETKSSSGSKICNAYDHNPSQPDSDPFDIDPGTQPNGNGGVPVDDSDMGPWDGGGSQPTTMLMAAPMNEGGDVVPANGTAQEETKYVVTTRSYTINDHLGVMEVDPKNLGGWTLDVCHRYEEQSGLLYRGRGTIRRVTPIDAPTCVFTYLNGEGNTSTADTFAVASEDGAQLFIFDRAGYHLSTYSTVSGTELLSFTYTNGYLNTVTDANGNTTRIQRNASFYPTAVIAPFGQQAALTLNASNLLSQVTNPLTNGYAYRYSDGGLLTNIVYPRGGVTTVGYDELGCCINAEDPAGGFDTVERERHKGYYETINTGPDGRVLKSKVERQADESKKRTIINPDGTVLIDVQSADDTSFFTYYPNGMQRELRYDPDEQYGLHAPVLTEGILVFPSGLTVELDVDLKKTLSNTNDPLSIAYVTNTVVINGATNQLTYDAATRELQIRTPENRQMRILYNETLQPSEIYIPGQHVIQYFYDNSGRLTHAHWGTGAVQRAIWCSYATNGYLESISNNIGQHVQVDANLIGEITNVMRPDGTLISGTYDAAGNITGITLPEDNEYHFGYDIVNQVDAFSAPNIGFNTNISYTWNLSRQLTSVTYPDGQTITNEYSTGGQLLRSRWGSHYINNAYDSFSGQVTEQTDDRGEAFEYGYDGSLLTNVICSGSISGVVNYSYNSNLNVSALAVNGAAVNYSYDEDGLLLTAGDVTMQRSVDSGVLTNAIVDQTSAGYDYTGFGELAKLSWNVAGTNVFSQQLSYDGAGRITNKQEAINGQVNEYAYTYDTIGRLVRVVTNGVTASSYEYDANGNRTSATVRTISSVGTYDGQDRMTAYGNNAYSYDLNGTLISANRSGTVTHYNYDVLGRLHAVSNAAVYIQYTTDLAGRRTARTKDGITTHRWLYQDFLNPVAELDTDGNTITRFVYGSRANVPDYMVRSGTTYRIISDYMGSVRMVVDAQTGGVMQHLDYDEFGNVLNDTNPGFQPFAFQGGLYDPDTGLTRFGYRDYDPKMGRWTAKDPVGPEGGLNLYEYCSNNPVNYLDPMGERIFGTITASGGGGAAIFSGEGGGILAVDFSSGEVHDYTYGGGGIGLGFGGGVSIQLGVIDMDSPEDIEGFGLEVSAFAAAIHGGSAQVGGTSWFGNGSGGGAVGYTGGAGAGIAGMLTYTKYNGKYDLLNLPRHIQDKYGKYLKELAEKMGHECK